MEQHRHAWPQFILAVNTDNEIFQPEALTELARILRTAARSLELGIPRATCFDVNGNTVGGFEYKEGGKTNAIDAYRTSAIRPFATNDLI